jgi:hypothetical protein
VCVWDEHAFVHASPWLYDFLHLFSFDSKLTFSLAHGDCSDVWFIISYKNRWITVGNIFCLHWYTAVSFTLLYFINCLCGYSAHRLPFCEYQHNISVVTCYLLLEVVPCLVGILNDLPATNRIYKRNTYKIVA